ncbi:hypothetical protein M422DRAFT_66030 [Sphaerobolus stellatus SS14]|nr:hypothetical protein M422DRAFT_66030 [Sphaerobolus stellatus SS14]
MLRTRQSTQRFDSYKAGLCSCVPTAKVDPCPPPSTSPLFTAPEFSILVPFSIPDTLHDTSSQTWPPSSPTLRTSRLPSPSSRKTKRARKATNTTRKCLSSSPRSQRPSEDASSAVVSASRSSR